MCVLSSEDSKVISFFSPFFLFIEIEVKKDGFWCCTNKVGNVKERGSSITLHPPFQQQQQQQQQPITWRRRNGSTPRAPPSFLYSKQQHFSEFISHTHSIADAREEEGIQSSLIIQGW
jgi:hypothetical protein